MVDRAELQGKTDQPVADGANTEDHHVHHHGVGDVLGTGEARFDQRKAGLHEKDQKAGKHYPQNIEAGGVVLRWLQLRIQAGAVLGHGKARQGQRKSRNY